jgi:hypothetical protein
MKEIGATIVHVTRGLGFVRVYNGNGNAEAITKCLEGNCDIKKSPFEEGYMSEGELKNTIMAVILQELPSQDSEGIEVKIY